MKNSNTVTKKDVEEVFGKQCVDVLVNILNSHHECKDSHIFIGQEHFDIWKVVGQYKAKLIWAYWNTEENDNG